MEMITYRITLDTHKSGIQKMLQGFETSDNMARRIIIHLTSSGDTFELPSNNVVAMMYVTPPKSVVPEECETSIHKCEIVGDTIVYDVHPFVWQGITEMQLKLIATSTSGAERVLLCPRFAVEVAKSNTNDEEVAENYEYKPVFTALEDAVAKADAVYASRVVGIEITQDCTFKINYADGTVYENNDLKQMIRTIVEEYVN